MRKIARYFLLLLFLVFILTGCVWKQGLILFNQSPITKENMLNDTKFFNVGEKVYYIFLAPDRMKDKYIRVQVFKLNDKVSRGGFELVRVKDYRLMKDERYYHTDYFVLHEAGHYGMQVFGMNDLQTVLARNDLYVK